MSYAGPFWFTTLSMYQQFGPSGPGPFIETGAILSEVVLVFLVRGRQPAISSIVACAVWWLLVYPVNAEMLKWTSESLPPNWTQFPRPVGIQPRGTRHPAVDWPLRACAFRGR